MPSPICALIVALAALLCSTARAQQPGEQLCPHCHTTGRIEVKFKPADEWCQKSAKYCSVFMDQYPESLGFDWIPCEKCLTPSVQARAKREFQLEYDKRKKWLDDRRREIDAITGEKTVHVESEWFIVSWDIPRWMVKRVGYDAHKAAHLFAERLEALHAEILSIMQITPAETLRTKHRMVFHEALKSWRKTAPLLTNQGGNSGDSVSLIGPQTFEFREDGTRGSVMVSWWDKNLMPGDEEFHQSMVHKASHHIWNDVRQHKFWLFARYGWVYEGLGHYLEIRMFGPPRTRCGREAGQFEHWKGKNWESNVKKALLANDVPAFQDLMGKAVDELKAKDIQFCWSWIDYLLWYDPTRMDEMLSIMKHDQKPTRDALREAYGMTVGQFLDGWMEFVRNEYSMKPKEGPNVRPPRDKSKYPDVTLGAE